MKYKIDNFDRLFLSVIQRDSYSFNTEDNNCPNIKVGDNVEIDGINGEVESLEWFVKMFNGPDGEPLKGDNVTILINQNKNE